MGLGFRAFCFNYFTSNYTVMIMQLMKFTLIILFVKHDVFMF